jgi:hypothetical protein
MHRMSTHPESAGMERHVVHLSYAPLVFFVFQPFDFDLTPL